MQSLALELQSVGTLRAFHSVLHLMIIVQHFEAQYEFLEYRTDTRCYILQ